MTSKPKQGQILGNVKFKIPRCKVDIWEAGQSFMRLLWEKFFDEQEQQSNCRDHNPVKTMLAKVASLAVILEEINFGGDVYKQPDANQNCRDCAEDCSCVHFIVLSFCEAHGYGIHAVA
jgi:hypothetical protein